MLIKLKASTKNKLKAILGVSIAGTLIGIIYANFVYGLTVSHTIEGAVIGLLISSISSAFEIFYFSNLFKEMKFKYIFIIRLMFYLVLVSFSILSVLIITESFELNKNILTIISSEYVLHYLQSDFFQIFIFSIAASFLVNFIRQISIMLGWRLLLNVMIGKYKHPKSDIRIFMFLDIKSATSLGEKFGIKKYSSLLQDFFDDLTDPVLETRGEIYQYIGDEAVITWRVDRQKLNSNCLDCFFMIRKKMVDRREYYEENYGIVPDFKAGIHAGRAIETEVGDIQKEIVYHGDVLNTASRLQSQCNHLNQNIIVSGMLLRFVDLNNKYETVSLGMHHLKGKSKKIELFTINNKNESEEDAEEKKED